MTEPVVARSRPARGPEDVLAGIAVRHEAYARTEPLALVAARRLASGREHRAEPWVHDRGDGTIVATLLLYRFDLGLDGRVLPAYGLGSVGTRTAERRRGHAATLCAAACAAAEREGRAVGLLYSAIPPAYYERLGFRTTPALSSRCERLDDLARSGPLAALRPLDPRREIDALVEAWGASQSGCLHVHRDREGFLRSIEEGCDDVWLGVRSGYARVHLAPGGADVQVAEIALRDASETPDVLRALARFALEAGRTSIEGWFDPPPATAPHFTDAGRVHDLPMLRGAPPHATARFWSSDHF